MLAFNFMQMKEENAATIAKWKYEEPYSIYNMDESNESILELMNGEYYCVLYPDNVLIGYICIRDAARVPGGYENGIYSSDKNIDIGLGLKPELTNKGFGYNFLTSSIHFLKERYDIHDFQLVVAAFNERAIKVYERVGFVKGVHFKSRVDDIEIDFVVMNYSSYEKGGVK